MRINTPMIRVERLHELLRYDVESGLLYWKVRRNQLALEGAVAGHIDNCRGKLYYRVRVDRQLVMGHWIVWAMHYGHWPDDQIDHQDGNGINNRISNLRIATQAVNNKNAAVRKDNKTGVSGVTTVRSGRYVAHIREGGRAMHLGTFDTLHEASEVRKQAEIRFGFHPNHGRLSEEKLIAETVDKVLDGEVVPA